MAARPARRPGPGVSPRPPVQGPQRAGPPRHGPGARHRGARPCGGSTAMCGGMRPARAGGLGAGAPPAACQVAKRTGGRAPRGPAARGE
eukprot:7989656-Lingulodinium_polyedra.AAC.1